MTTMIVRTAIPELDAITQLGFALQHSHNLDSIAAIENAVAIVSDKASSRGATLEDIYDCYNAGLHGHTDLTADRDEVLVGAHLARAFIYLDEAETICAVAEAGNPVWAAIAPR